MAQITYADKTALYQNADVAAENKVRDVDMNEIKQVVNDNETKILLDVTDTAPAECSTGDMYFDTTDNLIYTATATDTWSSTGVAPTENTIYVVISTQTSYVYNGITLVSVGGGSSGGGETLPVGTVLEFPTTDSTKVPDGWLFCDGSAVSRTTYADLFAIIGTSFGSGDGSTTFNLPTKEGLVSVGIKSSDTDFNTIGKTGGEKTHTLTVQEMPSHNHKAPLDGGSTQGDWLTYGGSSNKMRFYVNTQNVGGGQAHNNLQPYVVSNFIIKATQTTPVQAEVVNDYSTSQENTYSCDYVNNMLSYYTNEINTGKIWIDGKPIYRKVFTGTLGTTASNISFSVDTLIDEGGYVRYGAAYQFPIPSTFGTQGINDIRLIKKDANTLTLQYGSNLNSQNYAVWIEYTKN